jgi:multiple sugar transport system substrate-binding protein
MGDSCTILYYNKALLAESGVEFDFSQFDGVNSRLTWTGLIDLATQVTKALDPDGSRGILFPIAFGQVSEVYMMNTLPNSLGGANISEDGLKVSGVIDSEPWMEALKFYQDNVNAGIFDRGLGAFEGYANFYAGKIPFIVMTTDSYNYALAGGMKPEDIGFTYLPAFEGHEDQVATACGNWTAAVSAFSGHKDTAGKFVNWITYGEGNDLFLKQESMVPNMPSRFTEELYQVNPTLVIAAAESGVTSVPRAVTPGFNEYCAVLNAMWEDIRNGSNIEDTVADAVAQLDSALEYYAD